MLSGTNIDNSNSNSLIFRERNLSHGLLIFNLNRVIGNRNTVVNQVIIQYIAGTRLNYYHVTARLD